MVRGIDLQNLLANTQFVTREQQISQQLANFAPSQASQEALKEEDIKKERVRASEQSEQEQSRVDPNRRQALIRRRNRRRNASGVMKEDEESASGRDQAQTRDKGHLIDLEA